MALVTVLVCGGCSKSSSSGDAGSDTDTDSYPYGDPCGVEIEVDGVSWCRCDVGQTWNGETCEGDSKFFNWESASESCPEGYFVAPNVSYAELLGNCSSNFDEDNHITCDSCDQSDSCSSVFGFGAGIRWTASYYGVMGQAWAVLLNPGYFETIEKECTEHVRCCKWE